MAKGAGKAARRTVLFGGFAATAAVVAPRLMHGSADAGPVRQVPPGPWTVTDDAGLRLEFPSVPRRIIAYVTVASTLRDYGLDVAGVYGGVLAQGRKLDRAILGHVDRAEVVGSAWGQLNVERAGALHPDLVLDSLQYGLSQLEPGVGAQVRKFCPVASFESYGAELPDSLRRFGELAASLGASGVASHRAQYLRARAELRAVARQAPRVLFVSIDPDGIRIARTGWPLLREYLALGVPAVLPPGGKYALKLSWENSLRYPADVLMVDARTTSLQLADVAGHPFWQRQEAVRAGRVHAWQPEPPLSYRAAAVQLAGLTRALVR
ncbi:hypothetical protein DMP23_46785 [Amycolatopsis sp. A1MSW2902]|uniref:ABC transporter substrate-binding protein n=1 Tax=Amycolatopsis sp. A1MSW2902 TaxID=687413 RepID=UPI00307EACE3